MRDELSNRFLDITGRRVLISLEGIWSNLRIIFKDPLGAIGFCMIVLFILLAIFGPYVAKYGPFEIAYNKENLPIRYHPPSPEFWLGTTQQGHDVMSQLLYGFHTALLVGFLSAFCIVFIGTNIGIIAGYYGGVIDTMLMRITDVFYGLPFLPFALVLVHMFIRVYFW